LLEVEDLGVGREGVLQQLDEAIRVVLRQLGAPAFGGGPLEVKEVVLFPAQQRGVLGEVVDVHADGAVRRLFHHASVDESAPVIMSIFRPASSDRITLR
jgi:hypothetical protein